MTSRVSASARREEDCERLAAVRRYAQMALNEATDPNGDDYEPGDENTADMLISARWILTLCDGKNAMTRQARRDALLREWLGDAPLEWPLPGDANTKRQGDPLAMPDRLSSIEAQRLAFVRRLPGRPARWEATR